MPSARSGEFAKKNALEATIIQLIDRIDQAFKAASFPNKGELADDSLSRQDYGTEVAADLERWRDRNPDEGLLSEMHQELRKLSPEATRWIVPKYLRYALTQEAKYTRMEISFFVLSLVSHSDEETRQIAKRLSVMSDEQMECLAEVLKHLDVEPDWAEYMGEDIAAALSTLRRLRRLPSASSPS